MTAPDPRPEAPDPRVPALEQRWCTLCGPGAPKKELYPALTGIFERVHRGPEEVLWCTPQGLVANGNGSMASPLTWMDSRADGVAVTPRVIGAAPARALDCVEVIRGTLKTSECF